MRRVVDFVKGYFKGWNTFEILFLESCVVFPVVFGVLFGAEWFKIVASVAVLIASLLLAKAKVEGFVAYVIAMSLYAFVSFQEQVFGEVVYIVVLSIPLAVFGLVRALRNKTVDPKKGSVMVMNKLGWRELFIVAVISGVFWTAFYFILREFGTVFLVVSVFSLVTSLLGEYFVARRSQLGMVFYVLSDVFGAALWASVVFGGNMSAIPMFVMFVMLGLNDVYGVFEWHKLRKSQMKDRVAHKILTEDVIDKMQESVIEVNLMTKNSHD